MKNQAATKTITTNATAAKAKVVVVAIEDTTTTSASREEYTMLAFKSIAKGLVCLTATIKGLGTDYALIISLNYLYRIVIANSLQHAEEIKATTAKESAISVMLPLVQGRKLAGIAYVVAMAPPKLHGLFFLCFLTYPVPLG